MKIVVTGLGALSALGENIETLWGAIEQGKSGISPIHRFDVSPFDTRLGAMVASGDRYDTEARRFLAYGCTAAAEALRHASIVERSRVALVLGTCNGLLGREIHTVSTDIAHGLELGGPVITLSTACASSAHAIGFAADLVRRGVAEFVLTGGVDILSLDVFAGFHSLGLLSKTPCAPFSNQIGTTLGEGAAFMLLETERTASARGVEPLATFMGYGLSADAFHDTKPDPSGVGMARALTAALADAGLVPEAIDYLNAHGTGTAANDAAEWRAIQRVFGAHAKVLPVSSSKGFFGHTQGAAGALEAVVTLMGMAHDVVPPTANFTAPRPNSPTDPVAGSKPRVHPVRHAVCANTAFGGANAALVFGQPDEESPPRRQKPRPIHLFGAGRVQNCDTVRQFVPHAELRGADMTAHLLAGAVAIALTDARIRPRTPSCEGIGLFVGQTRVSPESVEAFGKSIHERGLTHLSAPAFTRMVVNSATGVCCRLFGFKGPTATLATGPDSGLTALVLSADHLAWRDDASCLMSAAVDEPGQLDDYDSGAACLLLNAGAETTGIHLSGWALAANCETAITTALAMAGRSREEVVPMVVEGPPACAGLGAVVAAINALKTGVPGPFLVSNRAQGSAGAAVIVENGRFRDET